MAVTAEPFKGSQQSAATIGHRQVPSCYGVFESEAPHNLEALSAGLRPGFTLLNYGKENPAQSGAPVTRLPVGSITVAFGGLVPGSRFSGRRESDHFGRRRSSDY